MSFDDWILSLHVLAAFAMVGATVTYATVLVIMRRTDSPEITVGLEPTLKVAGPVVIAGSLGTVVFGVWLAFSVGDYDIWDGWIIAALVLWAISVETGRRSEVAVTRAMEKARELVASGQSGPSAELRALNRESGTLLSAVSTVALLLVLIDMIWKPGA